ncbi:hypothetical protein ROJ8625_02622 [Roseivivax jejudonensis]|uniref:FAD assembly factor SdhE n=1 Tax=Roseivivax jejudonensis TaxID=1529041 RepID=A0A1X6ZIJ7_9RHOB|nr:succinate dehydrogenase assembly factor 2 [Roseivivax jejudonensis]SLN52151.1 hypothetical protein ROJ8625_02622 [Roseivivax jejudonensis]
MTAAAEPREVRLKRLRMRSMRRGIKEMDLILMRFADAALDDMSDAELDAYEALLDESDQDLYAWVSGQQPPPEQHAPLIAHVRSTLEVAR